LIRVVKESRKTSRILGFFNTIFHILNLKKDNLTYFEEFKPISLYNCIYNIIAKVIIVKVKNIFSEAISNGKFGFLHEGKFMKL
jgi:hypothetical protein